MPSEKPRSKEDTWRPEELEKSLKEIRGDRRSDRSRDDGGDRDRRHRPTDDGKERRSKDKSRRSEGDRRADQSTEKESDRMKREERRIKDEEREERHRRKAEERRKAEKERDHNINGDENNHNDRDRDRRRDGSERRKKRDTEGNDVEDRHKDGSKRRSHRDSDDRGYDDDDERRRRHKNDDDRRHKADDDDRRHSRKNEEERRRSHKDEDRRRSNKDDDDGSGSRRRSDREKERRSRNEGEERKRSHKNDNDDGGSRRRSDREKERRSHDEGEERTRSHRYDDDGGGSRRRSDRQKERRSHNEGEEKRRSHKDDDTAHRRRSHKDEDDDSRKRSHKNDEERRSHKSDDRRHSRREDEDHRGDDDGEYKRHREIKQHRIDSSEGEKHRESNDQRDQKIEKVEPDDNGADDYDDDFEDYEEDFEDDADESDTQNDKPQTEVDAVLKTLDAENNRLMAESRRSNGSDSTELSDERFRSSEAPSKQRTFINFVSAKQMVLSDKASLKTRTRGRDLLQLIDLDVSAYDMFDLPPVKEYDLYIRDFGRTDTAQVYVQTNEDAIDRDIQTEELEYVEKWSQHPCEESAASGRGDGETEEDEDVSLRPIQTSDLTKLSRFIHRAGQVVSILLEEESGGDNHQPTSQSSISVSQGFSQLANPSFLQGRCVDQMCFSPSQPNLLLTLYSPCQDKEAFSEICSVPGVICVWNISEPSVPQKILVCDSVPTSCCYSPTSTALVFAGMVDGALVLWDVREPSSLHTTTRLGEEEYSLRHPTYNTAGVLGEDNHQSAVVMVTPTLPPVMSSKSATSLLDDTGGASYQIVSVDQTGTVNLWVVAQISSPDQAGSESDLGLAPGGRVKLLRSSSFVLDNPVREMWARTELRVTCLQLSPGDPNQFIIGTDSGLIVHAARFGAKPFPRCYRGPTESPVDVTCIDYSPFCNPCFLAGCSDGTVRLYNTSSGKPLIMWPARDMETSVVGVQWSRSRPAVFYILYDNSTLAVYDLVETDARPVALDNIQTGRALGLAVSPDPYCRGQGQPDKHPHLVLTLETGKSEVHSVAKNFVEQQPFEEDFIKSYLDRF